MRQRACPLILCPTGKEGAWVVQCFPCLPAQDVIQTEKGEALQALLLKLCKPFWRQAH